MRPRFGDRPDGAALSAAGIVVVDEAYVDFVEPSLGHDLVQLVKT